MAAPRTDFYIHPAKRHAVYLRNGHACQACGYKDELKTGKNLTVEHIDARSGGGAVQGGLKEPSDNLSTLCTTCNPMKGAKSPRAFNAYLKAAGAPPLNFSKLRADSKKPLDLEAGAKLAADAKAFRAANKIPEPKSSPETQQTEEKPAGPGIHHGPDGKFQPGRRIADATRARQTGAPDLVALGAPIADRLIPGWDVEWCWVKPEDIGGALAMVFPDPLRERATIKVAPHPPSESVLESVAHEITHACLSPLTALIEFSDAAVGIEERITERIGKCFAAWFAGAPALARAMARALSAPRTKVPGIRARISALASGRGGKARMDASQVLDALKNADGEGALKILEDYVAEMVTKAMGAAGGGDDAPPSDPMRGKPTEGEGDGDDMETEDQRKAKGQPGAAPPPQQPPDPAATGYGRKQRQAADTEHARARRAADSATSIAVRARLRELETIDGVKFHEKLRAELASMTDLDRFEQRVADFTAGRASAAPGNARARSGQESKRAPAGAGSGGDPAVDEATLKGEGFQPSFIRHYHEEHAANPEAAAHTLAAARRARTQGDPASPWKKPNGAAGGH